MIGDVSLSNNNGVFLGSVKLSNLNATANEILYTADGVNVSGLTIGSGLSNTNGVLSSTASGGGVSMSSQGTNQIVSCTSTSNTLQGNSTLTFDGAKMQIGGLSINPTSTIALTVGLTDQTTVGNNSVAIGYSAKAISGSNIAIGNAVGNNQGTYNIAIGRSTYTSATSTSGGNAIIGMNSSTAMTSGSNNLILGNYTCPAMTTGTFNSILGTSSGKYLTTETDNTVVGGSSLNGTSDVGYINVSTLGYGITNIVSGSNQVQLGNSLTTTYCYGAVQSRSDARDKTDVVDSDLGLAFINTLHPVKYKWNFREDYITATTDTEGNTTETVLPNDGSKTRSRYHYGLIAQELKASLDTLGIDFGGYQQHSIKGGKDVLSIGYEELIGPLIKAVQELSEKVVALTPSPT